MIGFKRVILTIGYIAEFVASNSGSTFSGRNFAIS